MNCSNSVKSKKNLSNYRPNYQLIYSQHRIKTDNPRQKEIHELDAIQAAFPQRLQNDYLNSFSTLKFSQ